MQTIQQKRAKYALDEVKNAKECLSELEQSEFKSYAAALPAMIHMNGLGQAAAFYRSKGGTHLELYKLLSKWICNDSCLFENESPDLIESLVNWDMREYRLAQAEAQALMNWVKKFAKAYLAGEDL